MEDYDFYRYVECICAAGDEFAAIQLLSNSAQRKFERTMNKVAEMSACLRAIEKINDGKNEAIEALCED